MVTQSQKAVMDRAVTYLVSTYSPKGQRVGWLMIASILVEAWDLYSIAFVLIFLRDVFHPNSHGSILPAFNFPGIRLAIRD